MRVLIIEDDRGMASLLQRGLQEENQVVSLAFDGQSGLEIAKYYEFDVIVLDWMLPLMDGPEVARRLRKIGNASDLDANGSRCRP